MTYRRRVYGEQGQLIGEIYAEKVDGEFAYQGALHTVYAKKHAYNNMHILIGVLNEWNPTENDAIKEPQEE